MKEISHKSILYFQENVLDWFSKHGRKFPWRKKSITTYEIIISEILLQRTKAETVAKYYPVFFKSYPSWESLNKTRISKLEKVLMPIGLFRQRAALIKKLSKEMAKRKGRLPKTKEDIAKLPFAGQYITNAILLLVKKQPAPLLDVNMARVLERYFGPRKLSDIRYDPYLQDLAYRIVNHQESKKINWGILDFAAMICKSSNPFCNNCVFNRKCQLYLKQNN
jgi:A/G-specific adenine glycosylase